MEDPGRAGQRLNELRPRRHVVPAGMDSGGGRLGQVAKCLRLEQSLHRLIAEELTKPTLDSGEALGAPNLAWQSVAISGNQW